MNERTSPLEMQYDKLGPRVAEALNRRHFEAVYCPTPAKAVAKALSLIPEGDTVCWGGSATIDALGLLPLVRERFSVIDRAEAKSAEERADLQRKGLLSDTFLMSSNAISEDGQLFNIDGNGNRVAALVYGPKQVIVIAGMNKVVPTVDDAWTRARTIAAPINAQRFSLNTPCSVSGTCADCLSESSICASMLRTRICRPAGRIKVILVGATLGF